MRPYVFLAAILMTFLTPLQGFSQVFAHGESSTVGLNIREDFAGRVRAGTASVQWNAEWSLHTATAASARFITRDPQGVVHTVANSLAPAGTFSWDTSLLPDAWYDAEMEYLAPGGAVLGTQEGRVALLNAPGHHLHAGRLLAGETWAGSGDVHVVTARIVVSAGVTLTIEPGAIVKFCPGTGILVETGGTLVAQGTADAEILFTAIEDDTIGGDTNLDGDASLPAIDTFRVEGTGTVSFNAHTRVRYVITFWNWPQISIQDVVFKISSGIARIPVTLNGRNNDFPVTISYISAPGSALPGVDYLFTTGTLTWAKGQTGTKYAEIPLTGNGFIEVTRHFYLDIHDPVGATLRNNRARIDLFENINPMDTLPVHAESDPLGLNIRDDFAGRVRAGTVSVRWDAEWTTPTATAASARFTARDPQGTVQTVADSLDPAGTFSWDTSLLPDAWYDAEMEYLAPGEAALGMHEGRVALLNAPGHHLHAGRLLSNETWAGSGDVHVVTARIVVSAGVTLTIEPGAIVKFCSGTGILVETGGTLVAQGTAEAEIVFTAIEDDTIGGDTNLDGGASLPAIDTFRVEGTGTVSFNAHTRVRYVITFWNWPQISIQDVVYNINSGTARVPVTLNGRNNAFPVSVSFLTSPGSALPGVDYLSQTGTLTWATGQTGTKYAEIPLTGGEFPEVSRHFFLKIHDPVGATLQADRARVNLYENLVPTDTLMAFDEAVSVPVAVETRTDLIRQWVSGFLPLGWEAFWAADPAAVHSARITAFVNGQPYLIGGSLPPSGQLDWNTAEVSDGWCDLALEFRNAAGGVIAQWTARMLIRNSPDLVTHAGTLAESETWAGDKVHVIAADVLIPAGFTLTIEPGAVVKFCNGTRLTVADSGMLEALGLAESPIVFTPIEDDTAGGDTNMDGNLSLPRYGTYQVGGAGSIQFNDWTELRYLTSTHTGTLVASEIWTGNTLHHVTGNLAIPNGLTLRILPGAIVKINNQLSITVAAGGSLLAHGSLAQPIVVTSIRDDGHGGDTNDDGAATTPAPGDWKEIRNNGGTVSLSHTRMVYGGWAQFSNQGDGMIRNTSSGSLTIDSCELAGSLLRIVAVDSGAVTIQNSILRDGRWAVTGNASLVNCVVYGCETGLSGSGTAVNSSITHCHGTMISGFTVQYCNLWNPPGMGQQTFPQTGTNGNISADPKYQGAEAGLFMPRFGSPLIDAADGTRAPELDARGAPRVDDPHMPDTGIAAANGAFPDIGAYEVATGARAEFDLVVRRVSGPASASIGDTVRVEWDTANTTGTRTAQGPWRDAVALRSDDPTLGDQEIPLGDVLVQASLRPGDVQTFSATFTVPPLAEGRWRFQATTNARRDLFEGLAANNNTSRAALPVNIVTPEADPTPGNVTTGTTGNAAGDRLVKFRQTAGRKVVVRAEFLPAQSLGRLFAGLGRVPTRSSHDLASPVAAAPSGRTALFVPAPTADRWVYLLVIADGAANATFHLTIEDATLELTSIGVLRAGAGGTVTIPLAGAGFDETMTAFLSSDGGGMFVPADMVIVTDSMTAAARFDLAGATPGLYDVMLEFDGSIANLEDAFTVTAEAIGPRLEARIVMPDTVRSGRQYMAWFEYGNSGDADLPAPYFKLTSPQEMLMFAAMAIKNISGQNPTAQRPWRSGVIEVLGISETQPVSVLKPGEMRRIPVFFQTPITPGGVQIEYEWLLTGRDPINWDEIAANIRPEGLSDETWGMVFARLQSRIGFTWGDFLTRMRDDADYFGRFGQQVWLIEDLWQFEIRRAFGSHAVPGTLAAGTDVLRDGRGLTLSFSRWYPASLSTRFEKGILGYGWQHSLDYRLERADANTVKIYQPGGAVRSFFKDSGVWTAAAGDNAELKELGIVGLPVSAFELRERSGFLWRFNSEGRMIAYTDSSGRHSVTLTHASGRIVKLRHSDGQEITLSYNGDRLASLTDDLGRTTTYTYDATGDFLVTVTTHDNRTIEYAYITEPGSPRHRALASITSPEGVVLSYDFNSAGVVSSIHANTGQQRVNIAYGEFGDVTLTNLEGATVTTHSGVSGETLVLIDPFGRRLDYQYDPVTLQATGLRLPGGETVGFEYNSHLELVKTTDPLGHGTNFTYTPAFGSLESFTDARGNAVRYEHNAKDDLTAIEYPGGLREAWNIDAQGDAAFWTNRRGQSVHYEYDAQGRMIRATWPDGREFAYEYNARGLLVSASDTLTGTIAFTYDVRDYLTRIEYPGGHWLAYEYDAAGRRTKMTQHDGHEVRYGYDALGRLQTLKDKTDAEIVRYSYNAVGRLDREDRGNGTYAVYAYDLAGRLAGLTHHAPDGAVQEAIQYAYDVNGQRISMTNGAGGHAYEYDRTGQLIRSGAPTTASLKFEYDPVGNRIAQVKNGARTDYQTNALNQYESAGTAVFTHDADGNLETRMENGNTIRYEYDPMNRLVRILENDVPVWSCAYDALGNRRSVTTGGVTTSYIVDPAGLGDVVAEYDGAALQRRYIHGRNLVADQTAAGATRYYSLDALTSTLALTSEGGAVIGRFTYAPFGNVVSSSGETTPFQFVGGLGVMNDDTGLLFMRNRYYTPTEGRFIQADPIGLAAGDVNFYRYCRNSPLMWVDPSGFDANSVVCSDPFTIWDKIERMRDLKEYYNDIAFRDLEHLLYAKYLVQNAGRYGPQFKIVIAVLALNANNVRSLLKLAGIYVGDKGISIGAKNLNPTWNEWWSGNLGVLEGMTSCTPTETDPNNPLFPGGR